MKNTCLLIVSSLVAGLVAGSANGLDEENMIALTEAGKPACKVVVIANEKDSFLMKRSAQAIIYTVKLWSGMDLPLVAANEKTNNLFAEQAIVLATYDALKLIMPGLETNKELTRVHLLDEQGFVCVPLERNGVKQLFIASQTPRGVYNGCVYLKDFGIDGGKTNLCAEFKSAIRSPKMGGRPAYNLTIWNNEAEYTAADWGKIHESFARDGLDRVYFWVSGHFPSKKYPQAYKCVDVAKGASYDTTVKSNIGTIADIQEIIRHAHELGLKLYLGGALGGWVGTKFLTNFEPGTLKSGGEQGPGWQSLCPSHPKSRQALIEYYREMFIALPEADGLFIESADEMGACSCPVCRKPIDEFGSIQFGQSQLTLCQEIMNAIWRDHPRACLSYTIGYKEHIKDVAYYNLIRKMSGDPRFEWMEARNSWSFPGPDGKSLPVSAFSNKVMHWGQYYDKQLETLIADANSAGKKGLYGLIMSFEPGFGSGSFYHDIPFPTDILPYALTGFAFRELTWDPALTVLDLRQRIQKRFFGREAPPCLGEDLWQLREVIRLRRGVQQALDQELDIIEQHIKAASSGASPKTMEGLGLLVRAVNDARKHYSSSKAAK